MQKKNTTKTKASSKAVIVWEELKTLDTSRSLSLAIPLIIVLFFVIYGIGSLDAFRHQINPDATSYMQIAERYSNGDIKQAVNGYWSPLLSWLLVPFAWLNIDLQIGAKLIALSASLGVLLVLWHVMRQQKIAWWIISTLLFISAAMLLDWSLAGPITGDLLFLFIATIIPLLTIRFLNQPSRTTILLLGASGTTLYFAKAIGFYIFILYILLIFLARKQYSFQAAKKYLLVGLCFLALASPYIAAISYKYRQPTISTASGYNLELAKRFDSSTNSYPYPQKAQNLFPLKPSQYFANEEPEVMRNALLTNNPVTSHEALENYSYNLLNNARKIVINPLFIGLVLGIAYLFYRTRPRGEYSKVNLLYANIGLVTLAGVVSSIFELRYIYILIICSIIGLGVLLQKSRSYIPVVACCLGLLFIAVAPLNNLRKESYINDNLYNHGQRAKAHIPKDSNAISDSDRASFYCYYGQFRCLGNINVDKQNQDMLNEYIKMNNIKYYVVTESETIEDKDFLKLTKQLGLKNILVID